MLEFFITAFIFVLDQVSKYLAKTNLMPLGYIPLIQDVFHLTYVENRGAAFGMLQGQRWLFVILTVLIAGAIVYYLLSRPSEDKFMRVSLSFVLAGALGNLADRIRLGYVVDMFDFTLINFPVFNIADSSLVVGTILLTYYLLFVGDLSVIKAR